MRKIKANLKTGEQKLPELNNKEKKIIRKIQ